MAKGFLHLHVTVVVIFLLLFAYKVALLILSKNEQLSFIRNKTKVVEMILGTLILVTGTYLFITDPLKEMWLWVKLVSIIGLIPLGIIGLKKENKALALISLIGFLYFFVVSKTNSLTFKRDKIEIVEAPAENTGEKQSTTEDIMATNEETQLNKGKAIYTQVCAACHGPEGNLQLAGAANLQTSKLTLDEKISIVTNGKNAMMAYKDQLSEQEIVAVVTYTETLKK